MIFAFWAGGTVACLLLTRRLKTLSAAIWFSVLWPISIIWGMALVEPTE